jgi:peptide/nickel transport system permease protein
MINEPPAPALALDQEEGANRAVAPAAASGAPAVKVQIHRTTGYWRGVFGRLARDKVAMLCLFVLAAIVLMAIFAPLVAPADPLKGSVLKRLLPVGSPGFPLGSDELGRDMLSRLIHGGRLSLVIGITPVVNALLIGSFLGIVAGFIGGRVNTVIMRTVDVFYAFPSVLLAVAISGALGAGIVNALIALTIVFVPPIARVAESVTTQVRSLDFVEAARASRARAFTIIRVHILGNVLGPIFVYATSLVSVSMILASGLSFLGLGTKPPDPEWGLMLNTLRTAIYTQPLVAALPGVMIFAVSISFNLLSDGLRSAMDVQR